MNSNYFKSLQLMYYALLGGQLLFCIVVVGISENKEIADPEDIFTFIAPIAAVGSIILAFVLNNIRKMQAKNLVELADKKDHFSSTVLLRSAILEGGSLFIIVCLFIAGGGFLYLMLFALMIGAFLIMRPSIREMQDTYDLNQGELESLL